MDSKTETGLVLQLSEPAEVLRDKKSVTVLVYPLAMSMSTATF